MKNYIHPTLKVSRFDSIIKTEAVAAVSNVNIYAAENLNTVSIMSGKATRTTTVDIQNVLSFSE